MSFLHWLTGNFFSVNPLPALYVTIIFHPCKYFFHPNPNLLYHLTLWYFSLFRMFIVIVTSVGCVLLLLRPKRNFHLKLIQRKGNFIKHNRKLVLLEFVCFSKIQVPKCNSAMQLSLRHLMAKLELFECFILEKTIHLS